MDKVHENIIEILWVYEELRAANEIMDMKEISRRFSLGTVSGADLLKENICSWAEEFEKIEQEYPDDYLNNIRAFAKTKFKGKYRRQKVDLSEVLDNIDWDLYYRQKEWLARQVSELEPTGSDASQYPEGILNFMDQIQDAYELDGADIPWYSEQWYESDIVKAMEELDIPVTPANLLRAKVAVEGLFDNLSNRWEVLLSCIESAF